MIARLTICLYDTVPSADEPFSAPFSESPLLRVLDRFSEVQPLMDRIDEGDVDIVAVNLDGRDGIEVVERIVRFGGECQVLGVSKNTAASFIISAMRAGCGQFVCWPIEQEDLKSAVQRLRPSRNKKSHGSKRVCLIGSSGGSGATAIACNLAIELAQLSDRSTALIDMNLEFGDVCCAFDADPKYTIADICHDGADLDDDSLAAALHELPCGVSILARPSNLEEARDVSPDGVDRMLRALSKRYHHVLVDLPRSFSFLSAVAVEDAAFVIIVAQLGVPSLRNAQRIYQSLQQMGCDPDAVHLCLNRCNADFERLTVKDVEEHFRRPVFAVIPNDYRFVSASLDFGHPIGADAPASRARSAIQEMARKIAPEFVTGEAESSGSAGSRILNKLFGRTPKT